MKISLTLDGSGYSGLVLDKLSKAKARIGDIISISHEGTKHTGVLMPRSQVGSDSIHIAIKLENGYNIGITVDENTIITTQPVEDTICEGENASFSITASGSNLTYQWKYNGNAQKC